MLVVSRSQKNPILAPERARAWESVAAFNPSAVCKEGVNHLFYRAVARPDVLLTPYAGLSTIGYATIEHQNGGLMSTRRQVIIPEESWEKFGCEDPRATYFEGKWYVFYTALGGFPFGPGNIKVAVARGDTPETLTEKHLVTPFNAKAATLFPSRVNGEACLLFTAYTDFTEEHPRPITAIARAKNVEDFWNPEYWKHVEEHLADYALPDVRRADSEHTEVGATPIETEHGWLFIYSHIQNYYDESKRLFGVEALLLDLKDPNEVIARTPSALMVPEESYERYGAVPNIVFPSGAALEEDTLRIYYGAADTACATACLSLSDLLEAMNEQKRNTFLTRSASNPILEPVSEHAWESKATMNAAAVDIDGSVHLLYRAMGNDNTSVMGYARLADALTISERLDTPAYVPREDFEKKHGGPTDNSGCEDPRLTRIGDTLYVTYTAYDSVHETRAAVSSISVEDFVAKRFDRWSTPALLTPAGVNDKDVCILPGTVGAKYMVIHRIEPNICADLFDEIPFTREVNRCIELMAPRPGMWDALKLGAAAAPLKVPEGWLFIYHAIGSDHVYRLGAALLSEDATTVVSRTVLPIFEPVETWEKDGQIGNVVFSCGMVLRNDTLYIYYGGADTALGVATVSLSTLMKKLLPKLS